MNPIFGEYRCSADAKGRVRLPSGLRQKLGEGDLHFVIKRGMVGNLELWPLENWERKLLEWAPMANSFDREEQMLFRKLTGGLHEISSDSADRINIPARLFEAVGLQTAVVLKGMGDRVEIWDETKYDEDVLSFEDDFADEAHRITEKARKRAEKPPVIFKLNDE